MKKWIKEESKKKSELNDEKWMEERKSSAKRGKNNEREK